MGFAGLVILLLAFQLRLLHPPARSTSFVAAKGADDVNVDVTISMIKIAIVYDLAEAADSMIRQLPPETSKYIDGCLTPLQFAVKRKALATLKLLSKRENVNELDCKGRSALMHAAHVDSKEATEELLKAEANATLANTDGNTVAHIAAIENRFEVMKVLLDHDKSLVRALNANKKTPLHIATYENFVPLVKLILKYDPVLDEQDAWGNTPLMDAALGNSTEATEELLKAGANATLAERDGDTAAHIAAFESNFEVMKVLLDHDKSLVRAINGNKRTPLHIATYMNFVPLAKLMLQYDAVDDEEDARGYTPLTYAVRNKQKKLVAMILKNRENSFLKPRYDEDAALRMAKEAQQPEIVELLEQAAAKRIQDKKEAEDAEIVSLTEQAGPISIEHNLRHQKN